MRWLRLANFPLLRKSERFEFRDLAGPRRDGELELVEPAAMWVEPMLAAGKHPAAAGEPIGHATRGELLRFLERCPRGRESPSLDRPPSYTFWIRRAGAHPEMAGTVSLRIGNTENLRRYLGHIGYGVFPFARGHHLAERAVRLVLPLARAHGLSDVWITANPDNPASRRTCERLGATLVETVDLPLGHPLYLRGDRQKCVYQLNLH